MAGRARTAPPSAGPGVTSARKHKLRVKAPKPRNPLVAPAAQRKAGAHRKSRSAQRQTEERLLRKALRENEH